MRWFIAPLFLMTTAAYPAVAIAQSDGEEAGVTALTTPQDDYPDISPDGQRIVFQSNRTGSWQLWLMNIDGSELERLTFGTANDRTPVWSPDGRRILFTSDRGPDDETASADGAQDIFLLELDQDGEHRMRRLLADPGNDIHPEWANGGHQIVFNRIYETDDGADILIMDADGSNVRNLDLDRGWNTYANLTPDGSRLVYRGTVEEMRDGEAFENSEIFSTDAQGRNRVRLTDNPAFDGWPAVSPDGRWIAFASRRNEDRYHLYVMPTDGGPARQLSFGTRFHYTQPAWSPDGTTLAAFRWMADRAGEIGHVVTLPFVPAQN